MKNKLHKTTQILILSKNMTRPIQRSHNYFFMFARTIVI